MKKILFLFLFSFNFIQAKAYDKATIETSVKNHNGWYHLIELPYGITTPGINNTPVCLEILDSLGLPKECSNMRVIDLGCADGFYSFEMERRGADVTAIDINEFSGFSIIKNILDSKVTLTVDTVYNVSPEKYGKFDVVLFLGLLYHLRYPLLAFDKIHDILKPNGLIFVETQLIDNCFILNDKSIVTLTELSPILNETPILQFYPSGILNNDKTNMFAPNMAALVAMCEEANIKVLGTYIFHSRGYVVGQRID